MFIAANAWHIVVSEVEAGRVVGVRASVASSKRPGDGPEVAATDIKTAGETGQWILMKKITLRTRNSPAFFVAALNYIAGGLAGLKE
jgi:hypothetical protein